MSTSPSAVSVNRSVRIFAFAGTIISWFGVLFQFYLILLNRTEPVGETIIRFFSFFTILSNILVACCFTAAAFHPEKPSFFLTASTMTAAAAYIIIVGVTYNVILRPLWNPQGLQKVVDEILHLMAPVIYTVFWFAGVSKKETRWASVFRWLVFPAIYLVYTYIRGLFSDYYPYPFVDLNQISFARFLVNCALLFLAFIAVSAALVATGRFLEGKNKARQAGVKAV